jgi:hypothetical protein
LSNAPTLLDFLLCISCQLVHTCCSTCAPRTLAPALMSEAEKIPSAFPPFL